MEFEQDAIFNQVNSTHFAISISLLFQAVSDSLLGHERHLLLDPSDPLADLSGLKCDNAKARVQELLSIKG